MNSCAAEAFVGCICPVRYADSRSHPERIVNVCAAAGRHDGRSVDRIRERLDLESNANEYAFSRHFKGLRKSDVVCNAQMFLILITGLQFSQIASDRHVSLLCIGRRLSCCVRLCEPYANFGNVLERAEEEADSLNLLAGHKRVVAFDEDCLLYRFGNLRSDSITLHAIGVITPPNLVGAGFDCAFCCWCENLYKRSVHSWL